MEEKVEDFSIDKEILAGQVEFLCDKVEKVVEEERIMLRTLQEVLGVNYTSLTEAIKQAAERIRTQRKYILWCAEERNKLRRQLAMQEIGLEEALVDLRISKSAKGTVQHYEKLIQRVASTTEDSMGEVECG